MLNDDAVAPAERELDAPPDPGTGEILGVDMDYTTEAGQVSFRKCQACGDAVDKERPHPRARIRLTDGIGPRYPTPEFCGQECWVDWASRDRDDEPS